MNRNKAAVASPVSIYNILGQLFTLYRQLKKQERHIRGCLPSLLAEAAPGCDHAFPPAHIKRTTKYWQLSLNLVCGSLYKLTGNQLQAGEHKRIMLLSVFGPLFDDLFDDQLLGHEDILLLVTAPEEYIPANATDDLVKALYLALLRLTPRRELFVQHLEALCHWEKASLKQLSECITEKELYQITYYKSYYAVLLYCAVLDHYPSHNIQQMLYPVAGLMQLTNDAFDVWKDVHNGIYTLPNLYRNFEQLQQRFMTDTALINHQLWQLPYPARRKKAYAITIHSLHAMGWIALEQLKQATAGISTFAELGALGRQALVCDMDNIPQQIKWIKHIRRLANHHEVPQPHVLAGAQPAGIIN